MRIRTIFIRSSSTQRYVASQPHSSCIGGANTSLDVLLDVSWIHGGVAKRKNNVSTPSSGRSNYHVIKIVWADLATALAVDVLQNDPVFAHQVHCLWPVLSKESELSPGLFSIYATSLI